MYLLLIYFTSLIQLIDKIKKDNYISRKRQEQQQMIHILIVEDEFLIANLISETLEQAGYCCKCVYDGESAANEVERMTYDLVLLDVMLPKIDGFELIAYIRQYQVPVIFITAKGDVKDRVQGLRLGAEDYIVKPFDVAELTARVEVVLRRYHKCAEILQVLDCTIDTVSRTVYKKGVPVELTYKEFELLLLLIKNKNVALYRETIYDKVWRDPFCQDTRTVDLHIQRLRKKMSLEKYIQTVYKVGYRFVEEAGKEKKNRG